MNLQMLFYSNSFLWFHNGKIDFPYMLRGVVVSVQKSSDSGQARVGVLQQLNH